MSYLTGTKGNTVYLINTDKGEAYSFNSFGQGMSALSERDAKIALMNKCFEVDIVSILETPQGKVCDVFYNGYTVKVHKPYIEVFAVLRDKLRKANSTMFRISHKAEGVTQVLLAIVKDSSSLSELSRLLGISVESWLKIY